MLEFLIPIENTLKIIPYLFPVVKTLLILLVAYLINKLLVKKWIFRLAKRVKIKRADIKPLKNVTALVIYIIAFVSVLGVWGLKGSLTGLLAGAGFAGIVVGFATKDIIGNFISGLILIVDQNFNVGDVVEVSGTWGVVEDIDIRTSTIMTWDGELVVIPNSKVTNEVIKNRSLHKPLIRMRLPVGVDYGSEMDKVIEVCNNVMAKMDEIEEEPKPQVIFEEFADSSLNFELRFWINMDKVSPPEMKTKVSVELNKALKEAGIKIPYPHVEVIKKD